MIVVRNIDKKSSLKKYDIQYKSSAGSAGVALNAGVVPVACRLDSLVVGNSASAIAHAVKVLVNFVSAADLTVTAISASGGCLKVAGPTSPRLITAGSLISLSLSATAGTTEFLGCLRFQIEDSEK